MNFYTVEDFNTMRLFELDNNTYNKIEFKFAKLLGDKGAKKFMEKHLGMKLNKFSANSYVDVLSCIKIM